MKTGPNKVYWDTCIILAWFKDETSTWGRGVMDAIAQQLSDAAAGKLVLFTSSLTRAELLSMQNGSADRSRVSDVFDSGRILEYDVTVPIAKKAAAIRNWSIAKGSKLKTPDAIHLATAIIGGADPFYTLDGNGEEKRRKLIPLSGNVDNSPLTIMAPDLAPVPQGKLFP